MLSFRNSPIVFLPIAVAVLVGCGRGLNAGKADASSGDSGSTGYTYCGSTCRIFVTAAVYDANLGGSAGADSKCQSDANKPSGNGLYKALIGDSARHACTTTHCSGGISENLNWVLKPNTQYVRSDGTTPTFATNAAAILVLSGHHGDLSNTLDANAFYAWTGINSYGNEWTNESAYNCQDWTSATSADDGASGRSDVNTYEAFGDNGTTCDQPISLFCVEQ